MDFNQAVAEAKVKAAMIKEKIDSIDWDDVKDQAKAIDMGVAYTKALDALSQVDVKGAKQKVVDFVDSPKMDKVKSGVRTVKDFCGYVPYYAQSVPNMIREALGKEAK